MKKKLSFMLYALALLFASRSVKAQERLGLVGENYSGISNIFINPANSAHTPFQLDVNLGTVDVFVNNRIVNLPLYSAGGYFGDPALKLSFAPFKYGSAEAKMFFKFPSVAVRFENFTVGVFSNFRFHASGKNFPIELGQKFMGGFDPSYANEVYTMKKHQFAQLIWRETGFNISRVASYYQNERIYFGANIKALHAAQGFYLGSDNAYDVTILDSLHYNLPYYSGIYGNGSKGWGFSTDIGIKFVRYQKGEWFSKAHNENERLYTNYIFSAGLSVTDLGWVKFRQGQSTNFIVQNLDVELDTSILNHQTYPDPEALLLGAMGNLVNEIQANQATVQKFSMQLPTAFSFQADYHPVPYVYINATGKLGLPLFNNARVPATGLFSITPRIEDKRFMVALPLSLYKWREPTIGMAVRYRGLTVGSDVIKSGNRTKGFDHFNLYFNFKISIEEMEHSFLKPPLPPWIHMTPDTVALPEGGYTSKPSYNQTENARIYYSKNSIRADTVFISELGGGPAGRLFTATRPQKIRWFRPWKYGFGYHITTSYKVKNLHTGVYVFDNKVPFIVKPKDEPHEILVVIPTNEFAANNLAGGRSLHSAKGKRKPGNIVSLQRPGELEDFEKLLPLIRFFRSDTSLHVGYISEKDLDNATVLKEVKLLIIAGNSTHWTRRARQNFDKFLDKGGNALVVSKDFMHWQVRFRQKGTQMICHKSRLFDFVQDPYLKTTTWDDPKLDFPRPPRVENDYINGAGFPAGAPDTLLAPGLNYAIKKVIPLGRDNAGALGVKNFSEKQAQHQVLLFGDAENSLVPVYIGRRKAASGKYIQLSNPELLNAGDDKIKSFWYSVIRSTVQ